MNPKLKNNPCYEYTWEELLPGELFGYELMAVRIVITGSRTITDRKVIFDCMKSGINYFTVTRPDICKFLDTLIITGGANGVDKTAHEFAEYYNFSRVVRKADWDKHGKGAGYIRNTEMVSIANACIAIHDGESNGTQHCINQCIEKQIPVFYNKVIDNIITETKVM